jgi:hypothetical protein
MISSTNLISSYFIRDTGRASCQPSGDLSNSFPDGIPVGNLIPLMRREFPMGSHNLLFGYRFLSCSDPKSNLGRRTPLGLPGWGHGRYPSLHRRRAVSQRHTAFVHIDPSCPILRGHGVQGVSKRPRNALRRRYPSPNWRCSAVHGMNCACSGCVDGRGVPVDLWSAQRSGRGVLAVYGYGYGLACKALRTQRLNQSFPHAQQPATLLHPITGYSLLHGQGVALRGSEDGRKVPGHHSSSHRKRFACQRNRSDRQSGYRPFRIGAGVWIAAV